MQLTSFLLKAFALSALAAPLASAGKCRPKNPGKYPGGGGDSYQTGGGYKDTPTYGGGDSYYPTNGGGNGYATTSYGDAYPTTFVTRTSSQWNKWKTWDIQNTTTVYNSNSAGVTTTTTTTTISLPPPIISDPVPTDGTTTTTTTTTTPIITDIFPTSTLTVTGLPIPSVTSTIAP